MQEQDPSVLNAIFLKKFANVTVQSRSVNIQMLNVFSNFLHFVAQNLHNSQNEFTLETLKSLIQLSQIVEYNLETSADTMDASAKVEPYLKFLEALFELTDKVFTYEIKPNKDRVAEVLAVFWPLFRNQKQPPASFLRDALKATESLEKIQSKTYIYEIPSKPLNMSSKSIMSEALLGLGSGKPRAKQGFCSIFEASLWQYNEGNRGFMESVLSLLEWLMAANSCDSLRSNFHKCLVILLNLTNSIGEKCNYVQILFNRLIKSPNAIRNFAYLFSTLRDLDQTGLSIEKFYSHDHLLNVCLVLVDKILNFGFISDEIVECLEIIAQLSANWRDVESLEGSQLNSLTIQKILKFLTLDKKPNSSQISSTLSMIFDGVVPGVNSSADLGALNFVDPESSRMVNEYLQFRGGEEDDMEEEFDLGPSGMDEEKASSNMVSCIKTFHRILSNLTKNPHFLPKIQISSYQEFMLTAKAAGQILFSQLDSNNAKKPFTSEVKKGLEEIILTVFPFILGRDCIEKILKEELSSECLASSPSEEEKFMKDIMRRVILRILESHWGLEILRNAATLKDIYMRLTSRKSRMSVNEKKEGQNSEPTGEKQAAMQSVQRDALTFDFVVFYQYLKRVDHEQEQTEDSTQREVFLSFLIEKLVSSTSSLEELQRPTETVDSHQILLTSLLVLLMTEPSTSVSYKFRVKSYLKKGENVNSPLNLHELVKINSKQSSNAVMESNLGSCNFFSENKFSQVPGIGARFVHLVRLINRQSSNKLLTKGLSKMDLNLRTFLEVKFSLVAADLDEGYSVPPLVQSINLIRKNNALNSLDIILMSFCQHFAKQRSQAPEGQNMTILFHYLLKVHMEVDNGCFFSVDEDKDRQQTEEQKAQYRIMEIEVYLKNIQKALSIISGELKSRNSEKSFEYIKKLYQDKHESFHFEVAQYCSLISEGQIIGLISELTEDAEQLNILLSKLSLTVFKRLLDTRKIAESELRVIKQSQQKITEERQEESGPNQVSSLDEELHRIELLYFPKSKDSQDAKLSKVKIETVLLEKISLGLGCEEMQSQRALFDSIVGNLSKNLPALEEIVLSESSLEETQPVWDFKSFFGHSSLTKFIVDLILMLFNSPARKFSHQESELIGLTHKLLENSEVSRLISEKIGAEVCPKIDQLVLGRVGFGLTLIRSHSEGVQQAIKDFMEISHKIYSFIFKIVKKESIDTAQIIDRMIGVDHLEEISLTKYVIEEIENFALFIPKKNEALTESIFSYIMKVNETYASSKKDQLHIPEFICDFFKIEKNSKSDSEILSIEKNDKALSCTNQALYKSVKCDDKRLICYGCSVECHKGQPTVYVTEYKQTRCSCRDILGDRCVLSKSVSDEPNLGGKKQAIGSNQIVYGGGGRGLSRGNEYIFGDDADRLEMLPPNMQMYDDEEFISENYRLPPGTRMRRIQNYELDRPPLIDPRDGAETMPSSIMGLAELKGEQQENTKAEKEAKTEEDFSFKEENYGEKSPIEEQPPNNTASEISSQSYLLPVFVQMFNELYAGGEKVKAPKTNYDYEKISFEGMSMDKVMHSSYKFTNQNAYNVRLRKEQHLNGKSPAVSKKVIAQNPKFILVGSGSTISVHTKESFLSQIMEGPKNKGTLQHVHQHSVTFDVHTIDFSPSQPYSFVVAGLHQIVYMSISSEGTISRTNQKINVHNDYVNKVRLSKVGIFFSTSNEVRLLNWSFKQILTIKSESECLLKEWCLYERSDSSGATVYVATSQGNVEFLQVGPFDEGKKTFTGRVMDGRNIIETGASILVKDVPKAGKMLLGSFKDGTNLLGVLEGDSLESSSKFQIRRVLDEVFGKKFIMGQTEIIKGGEKELYVMATVKESLNPENSIHQGQLVAFRVRNGKCQFQLLQSDHKCEYFAVVDLGERRNWTVMSLHDDGSLALSTLSGTNKQQLEEELKRLRELKPVAAEDSAEKTQLLKNSISSLIRPELLQNSTNQLCPLRNFREFSDALKINSDYKLTKTNSEHYEFKFNNPNKVVTGISLPFIGNVYLPNRAVKNVIEVGLSNMEILHYFAEGSFKFRVEKVEEVKNLRQMMKHRYLDKLERIERIEELNIDKDKAQQLLNSLKQSEIASEDVLFYGTNFEGFKNRVPKFNQLFASESKQKSKDGNLENIVLILKIFLLESLANENFLCEAYQIVDFVKNLRAVSTEVGQSTFQNLKEVIVISLQMYQKMNGVKLHVFNDEFHPLKYATEERVDSYYNLLKTDLSESQLEEILNFLAGIAQQDCSVMVFYLAKYPSLLAKLQKKSKKIEKEAFSQRCLLLYVLGFQTLKFKSHSCEWILQAICSIFALFPKSQQIRKAFYQHLSKYSDIEVEGWVKNVIEIDGEDNVQELSSIVKNPPVQPPQESFGGGMDNMASLYGQFGMGGEMDEEAMMNMVLEMSKAEFKQHQEEVNIPPEIAEEPQLENQDDILPEEEMIMENEGNHNESSRQSFLKDLIQECVHCTKESSEALQAVRAKLSVLYVVTLHIEKQQNQQCLVFFLERIRRFVTNLSNSCDNYNKHAMMGYLSVFSHAIHRGEGMIKNSLQAQGVYSEIKKEVLAKLDSIEPEKVQLIGENPCILRKVLNGEKLFTFAHYAYGLVSLLLVPCEPNRILLSLECYWVLPRTKEHYTKMKNMTMIKEGINTGNIDKLYEVATQNPDVWRENADIEWVEGFIEKRAEGWEKALKLLASYYEDSEEENLSL